MNGLREVSRRAVRARIAEAAEALFAAKGFQATTVDEIAAAVGMSQRSFFRYFASKDDVVLDHFDRRWAQLLDRLDTRPPHEPDWDCLRRTFDVVVEVLTDEKGRAHDLAVQQIVQECPALHAAHLERADRLQEQMAERLSARAVARDPACRPDPVVLRAVVGAAFACLLSAVSHALRDGDLDGLGARLDRVMEALRPSSAEPPAASRPS